MLGHWSGNQSSSPKSGNCEAGNKAAPVWKPFHERGQGNNISKAETQATEHSIGQPKDTNIAIGKAGQCDAKAVTNSRGDTDYTRADPSHPETTEKGGKTQHKDRYGKGGCHIGDGPTKCLH